MIAAPVDKSTEELKETLQSVLGPENQGIIDSVIPTTEHQSALPFIGHPWLGTTQHAYTKSDDLTNQIIAGQVKQIFNQDAAIRILAQKIKEQEEKFKMQGEAVEWLISLYQTQEQIVQTQAEDFKQKEAEQNQAQAEKLAEKDEEIKRLQEALEAQAEEFKQKEAEQNQAQADSLAEIKRLQDAFQAMTEDYKQKRAAQNRAQAESLAKKDETIKELEEQAVIQQENLNKKEADNLQMNEIIQMQDSVNKGQQNFIESKDQLLSHASEMYSSLNAITLGMQQARQNEKAEFAGFIKRLSELQGMYQQKLQEFETFKAATIGVDNLVEMNLQELQTHQPYPQNIVVVSSEKTPEALPVVDERSSADWWQGFLALDLQTSQATMPPVVPLQRPSNYPPTPIVPQQQSRPWPPNIAGLIPQETAADTTYLPNTLTRPEDFANEQQRRNWPKGITKPNQSYTPRHTAGMGRNSDNHTTVQPPAAVEQQRNLRNNH